MASVPGVDSLAELWRTALGRAPRHLALAAALLVGLLAGLGGRLGTTTARCGALAGLGAMLAMLGAVRWHNQRVWSNRSRTLRRVLVPTNPSLGARALRTLALVERGEKGRLYASAELAEWQLNRLLSEATQAAVAETASRRSRRLGRVATLLALAALAIAAAMPARVVEGWDVLMAHHGRAPITLVWLEALHVTAQPPAYLRLPARTLLPGDEVSLPVGTVLAVTGVPVRTGRALVLTDGNKDLPFESDGRSGVIARYSVEDRALLRVAARFGEVLIEQPEPTILVPEIDEPPRVELAGAPRTIRLAEVERLELLYEVTDDHGIKQVDLVLRSGEREERRVLARKEGDTTRERGGEVLSIRDPFLRRTSLPVVASIEAKDNDTVRGPKWSRSAAIQVIPPAAGAPEAARLGDLLEARDGLVDLLAWQLGEPHAVAQKARAHDAAEILRRNMQRVHAGLAVPNALKAFLRGQAEGLEAMPRAGTNWSGKTEAAVLAVDVVIHGLGQRDAQGTARQLGELAEEVAQGAKLSLETERRRAGLDRMGAALEALRAGSDQLLRLGDLGRDLGSVTKAGLARIDRALARDDSWHVELAARHLAARLRRPDPSFATAWRAGVESGGTAGPEGGRPSDADQSFDRWMRELGELVLEHGGHLENLERSLKRYEQASLDEGLRQQATERARALRKEAARLPRAFDDSTTARGAAGVARQEIEAMADELERLALRTAIDNGQGALRSLKQAGRGVEEPDSDLQPRTLGELDQQVRRELGWAEGRLRELTRKAEESARPSLTGAAERERQFGQRAGNLSERGKRGDPPLPGELVRDLERAEDLMQDAARALDRSSGTRGLELGRAAQKLLEDLGTGRTTDADDSKGVETGPAGHSRGSGVATGGKIPGASSDTTEGFRRRVLEGLGRSGSGRLSPAVKRYAEGLLR